MIKVKIGEEERLFADVVEQWITQQINRRRSDGQPVCVKVTVRWGGLDMVLATPQCSSTGGGGRLPNHLEREVFELWKERGLNDPNFTGGHVVAFLKQLKRSFT